MALGLDICPLPALGYTECPSDNYSLTGNIIVGQTYDFSPALTAPFWALGFEFLGYAFTSSNFVNLFGTNSTPSPQPVDSSGNILIEDTIENLAYSLTAPNSVLTLSTSPGQGTGNAPFDIFGNPLIYDPINLVQYSLTSPDGILTLSTSLGVGTIVGHYDGAGNIQIYDQLNALWYSLTAPNGVLTLSGSFRHGIIVEQAFFFNSLRLYNCSAVDSVTAQMNDSYETPSGLVQTQFQVVFNHAAKTITLTNLKTQLPQQNVPRACTEILVAYFRATLFNYSSSPTAIQLPYVI